MRFLYDVRNKVIYKRSNYYLKYCKKYTEYYWQITTNGSYDAPPILLFTLKKDNKYKKDIKEIGFIHFLFVYIFSKATIY